MILLPKEISSFNKAKATYRGKVIATKLVHAKSQSCHLFPSFSQMLLLVSFLSSNVPFNSFKHNPLLRKAHLSLSNSMFFPPIRCAVPQLRAEEKNSLDAPTLDAETQQHVAGEGPPGQLTRFPDDLVFVACSYFRDLEVLVFTSVQPVQSYLSTMAQVAFFMKGKLRRLAGCLGLGGLRWQPIMVMLAFVCHDEHLRLIHAPLDVLPRRAAPDGAAFIVAPWMRGTLNWLLPILPP